MSGNTEKHASKKSMRHPLRALAAAVPLFLILATLIVVPPVAIAQEAPSTGASGATGATGSVGATGVSGATADLSGLPSISTDKADYGPGSQVTLSGANWANGEIVHIVVNDTVGQTWKYTTDVTAADGSFTDSFTLPNYFVSDYDVTATGPTSGTATTTFTDANASADPAQCQNGTVGPPLVLDECRGGQPPSGGTFLGDKNYVSGNSNGTKSHWREGDFIAYRSIIKNIASGPHTYIIHWDTVHGGKHALDYLGSFDATETTSSTPSAFHANNNNPCGDVLPAAQCNPSVPADSESIDAASLVNCGGSAGTPPAQIPGAIKIFGAGANLTDFAYTAENTVSGTGQCTSTASIVFTVPASTSTVVIAWSAHIAAEAEWGAGNSASFIGGSPYHMAQDALDGTAGSQDLQLATSAVFFPTTIVTDIHDAAHNSITGATVDVGTTVHDTADISGNSSDAGGTVTYKRFTTIDCTGSSTDQTVNVTNGVVPDSNTFTPLTAGSFSYLAVYSGDALNLPSTAACEPLTVQTRTPTVATDIHDADHNIVTSAPLGSIVHDRATVTSLSGPTPTGTVTFTFFDNGTCDDTVPAEVHDAGTVALVSGVAHPSTAFGPLAAGSYSFQAHYNGATPYVAADGPCEPLSVGKNDSSTVTVIHDDTTHDVVTSVALGGSVHDKATVTDKDSSGIVPTGTVDFVFFTNGTCEGDGTAAGTDVALDSVGVAHPSDTKGPLAAGSYSFQATYSGDDNFNGSTGACEPLGVTGKSQISPTQTTCQTFSNGTSATLDTINYTVKGNPSKISQVDPGVFFYWVKVQANAGSNSFLIDQKITTTMLNTYNSMFTKAAGSALFTSACVKVNSALITESGGDVTVSFNAATAGTYIIGIKYDTGAVKGAIAPNPTTVHYTFEVSGVGGTVQGLNLKKKS